jgi:hypothetical protein
VRDEDHRHAPLLAQAADHVEDQRSLLGAHGRERLVEQDDVGVGLDRARDCDRLTLPAGQVTHGRVERADVDADLVQRGTGLTAHPPAGEEGQRPVDHLAVQEHVLPHRELVDERQVLVDAVDAQRARVGDAAQVHLVAAHEDAARVGLVEPRDDLDQRGLAAAVVADQAERLAVTQMQVDVAQGDDGTEAAWRCARRTGHRRRRPNRDRPLPPCRSSEK